MEKSTVGTQTELVIIGGSAGSIDALLRILPNISPSVSFAVVLVLHRLPAEDQTLEQLLAIKSSLPLILIEDKTKLLRGTLYVAPADYHLLFESRNEFSLDGSEKVNYSRPSIDVSFESAAAVFGNRVTGILLSGANADGTLGFAALKESGARTIAQDPATAEVPFMPQAAIASENVDLILTPAQIVTLLNG